MFRLHREVGAAVWAPGRLILNVHCFVFSPQTQTVMAKYLAIRGEKTNSGEENKYFSRYDGGYGRFAVDSK